MADQQTDTDSEAQEYDHPIVSSRGRTYTDEHRPGHKPDHVTMIRQYSVPSENLWAYRVDDNPDEHIVVIDDGERYHKHVKRVQAERTAVVPGEKLWTIPENWIPAMRISRNTIAYGRYRIPETGMWVEVSIPTNDHVCDAWHSVRAVGELEVEPPVEVGYRHDARKVLDKRIEKAETEWGLTDEQLQNERDVYDAILDNWSAVEEDHKHGCEAVAGDPPTGDRDDQFCSLGQDWEYEEQVYIFRVEDAVKRACDISREEWTDDHDTALSEATNKLRETEVLPSPYRVDIGIDESAVGADYYDAALVEAGCSPAAAMDYRAVEIAGQTQDGWADIRGVTQGTVSQNVNEAKTIIGK